MLVSWKRSARPRAVFIDDLIEYIQECQLQGQDIILCLDANETIQKTHSGLRRLITAYSLLDVHETLHPQTALPSHRRDLGKIDIILALPRILPCVSRAGILPMDEAYGSDHRLLFIDIDILKCFHGVTNDPINLQARSFTMKNKKRTDLFWEAIQLEWERRKLTKRIQILSKLSKKPSSQIHPHKTQQLWDKVDKAVGYALAKKSECLLRNPKRMRAWSPEIAAAGVEKRYWKTRIATALAGLDGQLTLCKQATKYNIQDDHTQDIRTLEARFDQAAERFVALAAQATNSRQTHLGNSIQTLEHRHDKESKATCRSLKAIHAAEHQTQLFKKPSQLSCPM